MARLLLSEGDRKRLGVTGEYLPIDLGALTNREAIELSALGYRTPAMFRRALPPVPVDADGKPCDEKEAEDFQIDYRAWTVLVWLALRRAGIDADPETLEFDVNSTTLAADPEPAEVAEGPAGKASADRSTNSARKSSNGGATSPARSRPASSPS